MTAHVLDGRALSKKIKDQLSEEVKALPVKPSLHVILVGNHQASARYVSHKEKACHEVGIHSHCHRLGPHVSQRTLVSLIEQLNQDASVHGILLQLPLPDSIESQDLLELIHPSKDVDGFHPYNLGRLMQRRPALRPCTPYGVMELLKHTGVNLCGKKALVVGASNIVGRPMAMELLLAKCTVLIAHRFTENLQALVQQADVLISATGQRGIIQSDWIKEEAVVVDVGIHENDQGDLMGDLDYDSAFLRASWITPVPGGVGPMTIAMLLKNTVQATRTILRQI
jgi:methylenetetrahydrofolate dehydrogenase (NADP+)/methenyltetrahydrofolate cyclohydrolase